MRKLIAGLACRAGSTRLYGKPLQNLILGTTILDQILNTIEKLPYIETAVLGVAEGEENVPFINIAKHRHIPYIVGSEEDVLARLIACANSVNATDIFRVTTESPFLYFQAFANAWENHINKGNDVTVLEGVPDGTNFEIYTLEALERSYRHADENCKEHCSPYIRNHLNEFLIEVIEPPSECARLDLRLTVDYPEDLVVCRRIFEHFQKQAPLIPLEKIIQYLDEHPELKKLVAPYVIGKRLWPKSLTKEIL